MIQDLSSIPQEMLVALNDLTMAEEMLLSPILPTMSVLKTTNGRDVTRGFVANFVQDSLSFVQNIPRLAEDVPILIVKRKGAEGNIRETNGNRERLKLVGIWLVDNHPGFLQHGVRFKADQADLLPIDGHLDLQTAHEPERDNNLAGAADGHTPEKTY